MPDGDARRESHCGGAQSNIASLCTHALDVAHANLSVQCCSCYKRLDLGRECDGYASTRTKTLPLPQPVLLLRGSRLSRIKFDRLRNPVSKLRVLQTVQWLFLHARVLQPRVRILVELVSQGVGVARPSFHTLHHSRISKDTRFGRPWVRRSYRQLKETTKVCDQAGLYGITAGPLRIAVSYRLHVD